MDSSGDVDEFASLTFNNASLPEIIYYDATKREVKFATATDSGKWDVTAIDANAEVTDQSPAVLNAAGLIYVSYFDAKTEQIRLAQQSSSDKFNVTVATTVKRSVSDLSLSYPSISESSPFIAFYDTSRKELRDITFDGSVPVTNFAAFTAAAGPIADLSALDGSIYAFDPNSNTLTRYAGGDDPDPQTITTDGGSYIESTEAPPEGEILAYANIKTGYLYVVPVNLLAP